MTAKAMDSIAPSGDGTNPTTVMVATLDTTARVVALPDGFKGNFIRIRPVGAAVRWVVRCLPQGSAAPTGAQMNVTPVPADPPQQSITNGSYVPDGTEVERELPYCAPGGTIYLGWLGAAAGTFLQIEKGSGKHSTLLES
jgi:hypothetical protein